MLTPTGLPKETQLLLRRCHALHTCIPVLEGTLDIIITELFLTYFNCFTKQMCFNFASRYSDLAVGFITVEEEIDPLQAEDFSLLHRDWTPSGAHSVQEVPQG